MPKLTFTVYVHSDDEENDLMYLARVQDTFRLITEGLAPFGYTGDETFCKSAIDHADSDN